MSELETLKAAFRSKVGIRESGENAVIFNTHYYGHEVNGPQYPWCCAFIWDVFRECGLSRLFCGGQKTAYCPFVVNWARVNGQWVTGGYKVGDLLLYDWDGDGKADHIGFCTAWVGSFGTAIEGNYQGMVKEVSRRPGEILGALRPSYDAGSAGNEATPEPAETPAGAATGAVALPIVRRGDVSGAVLSMQLLLIHKWSTDCGPDGADADCGPNTERALRQFQAAHGLEADGECGPMTWAKLIGGNR